MGVNEFVGGDLTSWGLIAACSGVASSAEMGSDWHIDVGRARHGDIEVPIASFHSSQLTGDGPFLIETVIGTDATATIQQRDRLPGDPATKYC